MAFSPEFETEVVSKLATLMERTNDLPEIRKDVTVIRTKVASLETRATIFGAAAGGIFAAAVAGIRTIFGGH